jgi:hypothetical protein
MILAILTLIGATIVIIKRRKWKSYAGLPANPYFTLLPTTLILGQRDASFQ